jgi:E3 ubiquitin-protein ligase RAD18
MKLRRNWAVEELVVNFVQSRDGLLSFAKVAAENELQDDLEIQRPKKRRKIKGETRQLPERSTRSQSRRELMQASQQSTRSITIEVVDDSEGGTDSDYEKDHPYPQSKLRSAPEPEDGLVACPVCGRRMKEEIVYTHLDTCTGTSLDAVPPASNPTDHISVGSIAYILPNSTKQQDRLPTINYALLSENQLRKKLRDLGIPGLGSKPLLQRRHTEWLNLWNANCDSRNPRTKRDLLSDLDTWERTQGRQIANNAGPSGVMVKEFDRVAYAQSNRNDFNDLIRRARQKNSVAKPAESRSDSIAAVEHAPTQLQGIHGPNANDAVIDTNQSVSHGIAHRPEAIPCSLDGVDESQSIKLPAVEQAQSQGSRMNDVAV